MIEMQVKTEQDQQVELLEKWALELELGGHKQGMCSLKDQYGKYCCLGVAAEFVLGREFLYPGTDMDCYTTNDEPYVAFLAPEDAEQMGITGTISDELADWAMDNYNIYFIRGAKIEKVLSTMNDSAGMTFPEIAKFVRKIAEEKRNDD